MQFVKQTGLQWLRLMQEPYQSEAKKAIEEQGTQYVLEESYGSNVSFLSSAFIWDKTKQGRQYWSNLQSVYTKMI